MGQVRLVPLDALERGAVTDGGSGNAGAAEVFRDLLDQRRKRRFVLHVWLRRRGAETIEAVHVDVAVVWFILFT